MKLPVLQAPLSQEIQRESIHLHEPPFVSNTSTLPTRTHLLAGSLLSEARKIRSWVSEMAFLRWGISHTVIIVPPIREHEKTLENPFRASWMGFFAHKTEPSMVYKIDARRLVEVPNPNAVPLTVKDLWHSFTSSSQITFMRGWIFGGWMGVSLLEPVFPSPYRLFFLLGKVSVISMMTLCVFDLGRATILHLTHKKNIFHQLRSHPAVRGAYLSVYRRLYVFPLITKEVLSPVLSCPPPSQYELPSALVISQILPALTPQEQAQLQQVSKSFVKIFITRSIL